MSRKRIYAALAEAPTGLASYLPPERFWLLRHPAPGPDLSMHHAAWVKGVQSKTEHLDLMLNSRSKQ